MDATELGKLLGRATSSIQVAVSKYPDTLPPTFKVPGTRLVKWRKKDVRDWMDAMAQVELDKRKREAEFAARFPRREEFSLSPKRNRRG